MARVAVASASCSCVSDGELTLSPSAVGVPATGPWLCWITCVSSCASVWSSAPPRPMTMWLPDV